MATLPPDCDIDCTADRIRRQLADDPRDRDLYVALAAVEHRRRRPGAELAAFEAAAALGRPLRSGLDAAERRRLGALLRDRAKHRVDRGSPGADRDVARAKELGVEIAAELARDAALAAIAADLRHTDPDRRADGRARLLRIDPALAAGLDGREAAPAAVERTAAWLDAIGARRALHDQLASFAMRRGLAGFLAMDAPATGIDRWLGALRGWAGAGGRPALSFLDRALAAGANPCWFPAPRSSPCDVIRAAGSPIPGGPAWEPLLVTVWERDGVKAATADEALAWMIVAVRAEARGQLGSARRAFADHADRPAIAAGPALPRWATAVLDALTDPRAMPPPAVDLPTGPREALEALAAARRATAPSTWPEIAATAAAGDHRERIAELAEIARTYLIRPTLADQRAEDLLARAVDVAAVAPLLGELFAVLNDPARSRSLWRRALDADPSDRGLMFGHALAVADTGDTSAALQWMTAAIAASGDPGRSAYLAARGFAAAGQPLAALTLARQAIELSAPGDEDPPAGLAVELLTELGRDDNARAVGELVALPSAWGLGDIRAAITEAIEPADRRDAAVARLLRLCRSADPGSVRLARTALRNLVAARFPALAPAVP